MTTDGPMEMKDDIQAKPYCSSPECDKRYTTLSPLVASLLIGQQPQVDSLLAPQAAHPLNMS
jgi:hypothetical protein